METLTKLAKGSTIDSAQIMIRKRTESIKWMEEKV